jgi:uncharacterized protein
MIMSAGMINTSCWRAGVARVRRAGVRGVAVASATLMVWAGIATAQQTLAARQALAAGPATPTAQQTLNQASAQAAIERGLGAYQAGLRDAAISALGEAASGGDASTKFAAEFYLARIYAENIAVGADQTKAFVLFRKLADENLTVDPETSKRAPFVAKALIALAGYVRAGLKDIDLAPNPRRADDYLHHAAVFFGDREAQFELARTHLSGEASGDDVRRGLHYVASLTEEGHAPAQALLGELFWRGRHVKKDERRALALVMIAAENAPAHERIWIDDAYATIFCGTAPPVREASARLASRWRAMFGASAAGAAAMRAAATATRELVPERQCASGEKVALSLPARMALPAGHPVLMPAGSPSGFHAAGFVEPVAKK